MQADGFLNRHERHPVALTVAIGINLTAVTALLLAKGEIIPKAPTIFKTITPTLERPEPEKTEPPKAKPRQTVPSISNRSTAIETETVAPSHTDYIWPTEDSEPPATGGDIGATFPPRTVDPMPVLTDAAVDPRYASLFQPPYPSRLQRLEIEGKVVLKVLIGADGRVRDVQIVYSDDDGFAEATERQARAKWRFKPATRDGTPIETWKQMTVRFEIRRG